MPPAKAQIAVEAFRKQLVNLEAIQVNAMVESYKPVQRAIDKQIAEITAVAQNQELKPWQVARLGAMQTLRAQILGEMNLFIQIATTQITQGQAAAVALSQQSTQATMAAGLPRGVTPQMLANVGLSWERLPVEAFANFVGIAGNGAPLAQLLAELGPATATAISEGVMEGVALGYGPVKTAKVVTERSGITLSRAMSIARTETNRSYREASRLQYAANPNLVKGYRRSSAKDDTTCIACIALDGTLYEVEEPLDSHVNCRCAMVPETVTYQDLGLDVPDAPPAQTGQEWFANQPEGVQRDMMKSNKRFEAWKSGQASLGDMVQIKEDSVWGKSAVVAPLSKLSV